MELVPEGIAPQNVTQKITQQGESRERALIAMLAVCGIFYALPPALKVGPDWLVLVVVVLLVTPGTFLHRRGLNLPAHIFGYAALGAVTLAMIASLALLVLRLPLHRETPAQLLRAAAALWSSNVLVFASWYWRLDAGGPHQRDLRGSHTDGP